MPLLVVAWVVLPRLELPRPIEVPAPIPPPRLSPPPWPMAAPAPGPPPWPPGPANVTAGAVTIAPAARRLRILFMMVSIGPRTPCAAEKPLFSVIPCHLNASIGGSLLERAAHGQLLAAEASSAA